ncbi:gamma-glutamylcyclotransferase family protein [Paenibacillus konkukensis]|uniref:gamma-glutamylcyclotransferase family protein n=1 Tax=Paenibacillus konkukensis TaxID=2020716 RepID=UPI003D9BF2AF
MEHLISVFVYGTLMTGESNHHVTAPYLLSAEPGAVRGILCDYGPYPALILQGDGLVCGEWFTVSEEGLAAMDELEDYFGPGRSNLYDRVWIQDALMSGREGWVYVWEEPRGCPVIEGGSWSIHRNKKRV